MAIGPREQPQDPLAELVVVIDQIPDRGVRVATGGGFPAVAHLQARVQKGRHQQSLPVAEVPEDRLDRDP